MIQSLKSAYIAATKTVCLSGLKCSETEKRTVNNTAHFHPIFLYISYFLWYILVRYTNKESTFHNITTYHTTIPIHKQQWILILCHLHSVSLLLMQGWLCEMQCCGMCSPCLCTLSASASIHPPIPTFRRFLQENLFKFLVFCSFLLRGTAHALVVDVSSVQMHLQMTSNSYCAQQLKSAEVTSPLRSKQSTKAPPLENSLATGGCLECNTDRVTALGWLKKEENEQF